jgi:transcription antitermination factor NusG
MERHWAVLRTQPRREPVAARSIGARRVESYLPWLPGARASDAAHPLFPGYVFARVATDSDDLLRIRSAPGVAYVLPRDSTPVLLPDRFVESIRAHERELSAESPARTFHRGDRVIVVSGPFKWIEGLFDRTLSASGRVRILLNLVHGSVSVQMEAAELKRAG